MTEENINDDADFQVKLDILKDAAVAMESIADSFTDDEPKASAKAMAWTISWAVTELAKTRSEA